MVKKTIFSILISIIFALPVQAEKAHEAHQVKENHPNMDIHDIERFKKFKRNHPNLEGEDLKKMYKFHQKYPDLTKEQLGEKWRAYKEKVKTSDHHKAVRHKDQARDDHQMKARHRNDRKGSLKSAVDYTKRNAPYHKTAKKDHSVNNKKN